MFKPNQTITDAEITQGEAEISLEIVQEELEQALRENKAFRTYNEARSFMIGRRSDVSWINIRAELVHLDSDKCDVAQNMVRTFVDVGLECNQYVIDQSIDEILSGHYIDSFNYYVEFMSIAERAERTLEILEELKVQDGPVYVRPTEYILFMHDMKIIAQDQAEVIFDCFQAGDDGFTSELMRNADLVLEMFNR